MKHMTTIFVLAAVAALALSLSTGGARAESNVCWHQRDCAPRQLCVADDEASSTGRCRYLRVLP